MALTDLTNTTWTLNDSLTSYAGGTFAMKTYSIDIETETALPAYGGNVGTFIAIRIGYESGNERNQIRVYTSLPESYSNYSSLATGTDTKTLPDTWSSRYEGTFTITGGTDATNSTLIAWIEDNCTQYVPPTPDVVVTYEGANIVELSEAGTKTLKTAGKYLTDDVMLTYSGSSGSSGYIETDPTVPSWAKAASKPTYTASEVGAAATSHTHGNITNTGDITTTATIASGDRIVINDESASKITNSSITFGTGTTTFLANNGTWQTPGGAVSSVNGMTGAVTITQADVGVPEITISNTAGGYYTTYSDGVKYLTISPSSSNFYVGAGLKDTLSSEDTMWMTLDTRIADTSISLSSGSIGSGKTLYLRRCGHMVQASMANAVNIPSGSNNKALSCGTIPEGYRPEHNAYMGGPVVANNSISGQYRWMIVPGGAITLISSITGTREEPISMTWYTSNNWPT